VIEGGIHVYANERGKEGEGTNNYECKWTVTGSAGPQGV